VKKTVLDIIFLSCLIFFGQFILPWYILVILSFLYGTSLARSWRSAFFITFCAVFLVWALYPLVISLQDAFRTAEVIGAVFGGLGAGPILLINGLVFGFLGGLAGLSGYFIQKIN